MSAGFRYSLRVPEFTKEQKSADDIVVTYQVDILVQVPGSQETAPPTSQWRRFSEFRQLYTNLKQTFPHIFQGKHMEPPPKKKFRFVNNNDKLLEDRRVKLEQWLWRLLRFPEVAQSKDMRSFLQLDLAVRAASVGMNSPQGSMVGNSLEFGNPDERSELDGDAQSEVSAPSGITSFSQAHTDTVSLRSSRTMGVESTDPLRMGLRMEQRSDLRQLVAGLSAHIDKASLDLQEATTECKALRQKNMELNAAIQELTTARDDAQQIEKDDYIKSLQSELETSLRNLQESEERALELEKVVEEKSQILMSQSNMNGFAIANGEKVQAELREEIDALSKTNDDLKAQLVTGKERFKEDNKLLAREIAKLRDSNKQLQAEASELRGGLDEKLMEAKTASEEEKMMLQSRVQALEVALKKQNDEFQEPQAVGSQEKELMASAAVSELERLCEELKADNDELRTGKREMDAKLHAAMGEKNVSQDELRSVRQGFEAECTRLKALCEASEARADGLKLDLQQQGSTLALISTERDNLKAEIVSLQESQQSILSLESKVETLTAANLRLGDLPQEMMQVREQLSSAVAEVETLTVEVDRLKEENASMATERTEVLSQNTALKAEIDALKQFGDCESRSPEESAKVSNDISILNAEKAQLTSTIEEQEKAMAAQKSDLMMQIEQLSVESQKLGLLKAEIEDVRKERDIWKVKCEKDVKEKETQLADQTRALQMTLVNVSELKEALGHSESRERVAAQEAIELQSKIKELDAALLESKNCANGTEELSISHVAEVVRLQSEIESLKEENAVLKHSDSMADLLGEADDRASTMTTFVNSMCSDVAQCTSSVPELSGQTPLNPDVVTDLMEKVAQSNSTLEEITAQVNDFRSLPPIQASEAGLGAAIAELVTNLVSKCREVNEMRVDQLLNRAEVASGPVLTADNSDIQKRQRTKTLSLGSAKSLESNQGLKGVFSRIGSSVGQSPEQNQGTDGDSKVKKFLGGVGSKMSSSSQGFMNFMQRGPLQANLLETPINDSSASEPNTSQGEQNLNSSQR